jgi:hypothetical protein
MRSIAHKPARTGIVADGASMKTRSPSARPTTAAIADAPNRITTTMRRDIRGPSPLRGAYRTAPELRGTEKEASTP